MRARQQRAAPLGFGRLSEEATYRTTRVTAPGAAASGAASGAGAVRPRADGGAGQGRDEALRPRL